MHGELSMRMRRRASLFRTTPLLHNRTTFHDARQRRALLTYETCFRSARQSVSVRGGINPAKGHSACAVSAPG